MIKERLENIFEFLEKGQAAIITDENNRFYFTGMRSSAGTVLLIENRAYLLIDFRYYEKAKLTVKTAEVILCTKLFEQLKSILDENNIENVILENGISVAAFNSFKNKLSAFNVSASEEFSNKISILRSIKSEKEVEFIRQAQDITDKTFDYILNRIAVGKTELEIMLDMEFFARSHGSEGVAFDYIVVSGKNSSLPHGVPTAKKIEKGDFITMDFGAVVNGYRSDMTRTVAVGNVNKEQEKVYDTVLSAQKSALNSIKPNAVCYEIDKVARDIIDNAGYEGCFGHGLGHSVGLEIHESPAFNTRDKTLLKKGMVLTVEPGIYIENKFGVRIEDMVVITDNGYENLTKSKKELIVI